MTWESHPPTKVLCLSPPFPSWSSTVRKTWGRRTLWGLISFTLCLWGVWWGPWQPTPGRMSWEFRGGTRLECWVDRELIETWSLARSGASLWHPRAGKTWRRHQSLLLYLRETEPFESGFYTQQCDGIHRKIPLTFQVTETHSQLFGSNITIPRGEKS